MHTNETGWGATAAALFATTFLACASNPHTQLPTAIPPVEVDSVPHALAAAAAPTDPINALIASSEHYFTDGEAELKLGHMDAARRAFDAALEVLLESPHGARTDTRTRLQFERLVDRVSAYEMAALAQGDGFAEKRYESASIDELLAVSVFDAPQAPPDLEQAVQTDLETTRHDIPIALNAKVLKYIELFQGRLREFIEEGLSRGTQYASMIQSVFQAEGLPLDLAYVPLVESAFKPNALSRSKAKGVWQFVRGTGLLYGLKQDWFIDERSDPDKATRAAAKYLRTLYETFHGDWYLALASYNGGPGRVQRAMKRSRLSDYWALSATKRYLPRETREYVPMIMAAIVIARNPERYGFSVAARAPLAYEVVTVPSAVDLRRIAEWSGATIDDIQTLNPELRRWTTPVNHQIYELKVPAGSAAQLRERMDSTPASELTALQWHTVKRGESLLTIARKLRVSRADLAGANNLKTTSRVRPGQELIIPSAPPITLTARVESPVSAPETISVEAKSASGATVDIPQTAQSEPVKLVYRVRRGDTLSSIARLFRTSVASLKTWNKRVTNRINTGERLTVFTSKAVAAALE